MAQRHIPSFSTGWRGLYECAILELDRGLLPDRIDIARRAILDRAEEILTQPSGAENGALRTALHALQILEEVTEREKMHRGDN
ncbi:MAG: hypothetical protein JWQ87_94 [Candidatus Sulfotelmatobacter sp.]|nr:hypothetical protein [Candidatus Sulfotelmatobacter sp.]